MKQIISILLIILLTNKNSICQKDECDKFFFKQKKSSKNSVFYKDSLQMIKTKYCSFYNDNRRILAISFLQDNGQKLLSFESIYIGEGFKQYFILGQNFRVTFMLKDSSSFLIKFSGNEQGDVNQSGKFSSNTYPLSDSLLKVLMIKPIVYFEIQNPYGTPNESRVKGDNLTNEQSIYFLKMACCFYNRLNGIKLPVNEENED